MTEPRRRITSSWLAVVAVALVVGLALLITGDDDGNADMDRFEQMVDAGASCHELVMQRQEFEPTDEALATVNRTLDELGCEDGQRDDLPG